MDGSTDGRHKIVSSEEKSSTLKMAASWKETHLPTILSRYKLEDIFNADVFGLFFQALPNKTLELKGENAVVVNAAKLD